MFDESGENWGFLKALIWMFMDVCFFLLLLSPGWEEEVWQGEWKILFYSWQTFKFVCEEKGVSFARGKLFP